MNLAFDSTRLAAPSLKDWGKTPSITLLAKPHLPITPLSIDNTLISLEPNTGGGGIEEEVEVDAWGWEFDELEFKIFSWINNKQNIDSSAVILFSSNSFKVLVEVNDGRVDLIDHLLIICWYEINLLNKIVESESFVVILFWVSAELIKPNKWEEANIISFNLGLGGVAMIFDDQIDK